MKKLHILVNNHIIVGNSAKLITMNGITYIYAILLKITTIYYKVFMKKGRIIFEKYQEIF